MRVAMLMFIALAVSSLLVAADPFVGTWTMISDKSTFSGLKPKQITIRFEVDGDALRYSFEVMKADGTTSKQSAEVVFDGREHEAMNPALTASHKRTNLNSIEAVLKTKVDGSEAHWQTYVISPDGKTMTHTSWGITPAGAPYKTVIVLERQ